MPRRILREHSPHRTAWIIRALARFTYTAMMDGVIYISDRAFQTGSVTTFPITYAGGRIEEIMRGTTTIANTGIAAT